MTAIAFVTSRPCSMGLPTFAPDSIKALVELIEQQIKGELIFVSLIQAYRFCHGLRLRTTSHAGIRGFRRASVNRESWWYKVRQRRRVPTLCFLVSASHILELHCAQPQKMSPPIEVTSRPFRGSRLLRAIGSPLDSMTTRLSASRS